MKVVTASAAKLIVVKRKQIHRFGNEWGNILTHTKGKALSLKVS